MKALKFFTCFILLFFLGFAVSAQDNNEERLNLPGDNLNLYAVMKLFQESETLEGFERNLNAEESKINNLDLNGDDKIDYIRVLDYPDGNDHTIVLQVAVNEKENQDVAVFTVQKDANNQVQIQLIGDMELYGKDYIIEPNYADNASGETPNPGYTGNSQSARGENVVVTRTTYVEVASWPLIAYMFTPSYVVWRSPWYWGYYPGYWNPWQPYYWDYYYGYHSHWNHYYYGHYRPWHHYRYAHYNDHYYNHNRSYSSIVQQHRQGGVYRNTYSRPDQRREGSEAYTKRYSDNGNRTPGRTDNIKGVNRQESKQRINESPGRQGENKPAVRKGTPVPSNREGVNKPATRKDENRPSNRPGINKSETRPGASKSESRQDVKKSSDRQRNDRPAVKSENKRSAPKQESTKRSSETRRSSKNTDKNTPRK